MKQEKAPFFGKWMYWYAVVIATLMLLIAVFYVLTQNFKL